MLFSSLFRTRSTNRAAKPASGKPFRPQLEALGDRVVPSTLKVTTLADGGKGSLRYEIAAAQSGDTIVFNKSLNGGTITLSSGTELSVTKNLTIQGPGAGLLTISSPGFNSLTGGTDAARVFEVGAAATVTLSGLTIRNGGGLANVNSPGASNDYFGGGVLNHGRLTVSGCTLSGNTASYGGAIFNDGTLTVSNSTLSGNTAAQLGGGIDNVRSATVSNSTLSGDSAWQGGGIYNDSSAGLSLFGCTLSGDAANGGPFSPGAGGGICNAGTASQVFVMNSTFSGDSPDAIAGPYVDGGGNTFA